MQGRALMIYNSNGIDDIHADGVMICNADGVDCRGDHWSSAPVRRKCGHRFSLIICRAGGLSPAAYIRFAKSAKDIVPISMKKSKNTQIVALYALYALI